MSPGQNVTRIKCHPDKMSPGQNVTRTKCHPDKMSPGLSVFLISNYAINYQEETLIENRMRKIPFSRELTVVLCHAI